MVDALLQQQEEDESFWNFDFAIMAIFASLFFNVSAQFGRERLKLENSDYWNKNQQRFNEGVRGTRTALLQAIAVSLLLIVVAAIAISVPTRALDLRMTYILEGLSLVFAAVVLGAFSFDIANWTGLYHKVWEAPVEEAPHTLREMKFNARWTCYRIFGRYFFFLMPFYQGQNAGAIPISMLSGIVVALFVDYCVYMARRKPKRRMRPIVITLITVDVFGSSMLLANGAYYIAKVWEKAENPQREKWWITVLFLGMFVETLLHIGRWWISRQHEEAARDEPSFIRRAADAHAKKHRPRMVSSLVQEMLLPEDREAIKHLADLHETDEQERGDENESIPEHPCEKANADVENDVQKAQDDSSSPTTTNASKETRDENELDGEGREGQDDEDCENPSYRQMFCRYWTCCGCVRGERGDDPWSEKAWWSFLWTIWFVLVFFSLWLVIVNLGATAQQEAARDKLPYVHKALYENINDGKVCAFDNKGEASNITTFDNKEAAHAEGFLVVHCGECGACSDYHNLRLEYTTREYLAAESARCARKSLTGGRDAVLQCLKGPRVGFQGECAECWVDDILCTKGFCSFIFLQSTMINTISNMQVNAESITAAACEEAHCEAGNPGDFVYCSGATRRRMNVTSTIDRPGTQRCGIVDVDWAEIFPE